MKRRHQVSRMMMVPPEHYEEIQRRKYDVEPEPMEPQLSHEDTKRLRTLVRKYGADLIVHAAVTIDIKPGKKGRPSRGNLPYFERLAFAQCVEGWAQEHRELGSRKPIQEALSDMYSMTVGPEEHQGDPAHFARWEKTAKKKWHQGRRELQVLRKLQETYGKQRKKKARPAGRASS